MEFKQLEVLVAVVETGSFSKAGNRVYLSQPSITMHINALEEEFGQQLLVRNRNGAQLTDKGKILYEYACSALHYRDDILETLLYDQDEQSTLRIAASTIPAQYLLPKYLAAFKQLHRDVQINVVRCDSRDVGTKLQDRQADIGFSGTKSTSTECLYYPIASDCLVVITPNTSEYQAFSESKPLPLECLENHPFIARESGSGTHREFMEYLNRVKPNTKLNVQAVFEDTVAIKNAVAAGMGIAVMSNRAADDYVKLGYVRAFPLGENAQRELYVVRRKKDRLFGRTLEFFEFVIEQSSQES